MTEQLTTTDGSLFSVDEILYLVFRHKWKILWLSVLGLLAAAVVYAVTPRVYRSEASLLVRYVSDRPALDPEATGERVIRPDERGLNVINTEVAILTSLDLIGRAVDEVGPARIVAAIEQEQSRLTRTLTAILRRSGVRIPGVLLTERFGNERAASTAHVLRRLAVLSDAKSNVLRLTFDGPSPEIAQQVLQSLVENYLRRHSEIHRAAGTYEFLSQQTDQYRSRLAQTEEELTKLKAQAGVASLEQSQEMLSRRLENLQAALFEAESGLAASRAKIKVLSEAATSRTDVAALPLPPQPDALARLPDALTRLRLREQELLTIYTAESLPVRNVRSQIAQLEAARSNAASIDALALLDETADATALAAPTTPVTAPARDALTEEAMAAYFEAKVGILKARLEETQQEIARLRAVEDRIAQLQRRKEIEETNYRYFAKSLEKARIDAALDSEKMSNISIVQPATSPLSARRPFLARNVLVCLFGGLCGGLLLAFVSERLTDRTVRRSSELEAATQVPVLLSIPYQPAASARGGALAPRRPVRLLAAHGGGEQALEGRVAAVSSGEGGLSEYYEALRDRVLGAIQRSSGKPCLLGITGCSPGCGVSTTASGLALALARNGDGRVLLLDASALNHAGAKGLWKKGSPLGMLDLTADAAGNVSILQPNLFVLAAEEITADGPQPGAARGLDEILDYVRRSAYAFVIFDLPVVSETSLALRLAPRLDGTLLLVEAETVHREAAARARRLLEGAHAVLIGTVLAKKRRYVPAGLHPEL